MKFTDYFFAEVFYMDYVSSIVTPSLHHIAFFCTVCNENRWCESYSCLVIMKLLSVWQKPHKWEPHISGETLSKYIIMFCYWVMKENCAKTKIIQVQFCFSLNWICYQSKWDCVLYTQLFVFALLNKLNVEFLVSLDIYLLSQN